ncbi:24958_t:CDS:1, partial [Dentiscutata erythropus]
SYPNSNQQIKPELMKIVLKNSLVDYHLSCQWTSDLLEKTFQFLTPKKVTGSLAVTNNFDREEL